MTRWEWVPTETAWLYRKVLPEVICDNVKLSNWLQPWRGVRGWRKARWLASFLANCPWLWCAEMLRWSAQGVKTLITRRLRLMVFSNSLITWFHFCQNTTGNKRSHTMKSAFSKKTDLFAVSTSVEQFGWAGCRGVKWIRWMAMIHRLHMSTTPIRQC